MDKNIGIIGAGNIGEALINGFLSSGLRRENIIASDINQKRLNYISKKYKIQILDNLKLVEKSDIIFICVKPKDVRGLLEEIKNTITPEKILISIAAGITTKFIEKIINKKVPVIRCMPNTPAMVSQSMSVLYKGRYATNEHLNLAKKMFESIGKVLSVENEDVIDSVTALSGSGPAYLFYFAEALISAGKEIGLNIKMAKELVYQTIKGAAELLLKTKSTPEELRKMVTSPGGTTEAAINSLENKNFKKILIDAIKKAKERAKELKL